MSTSDKTVMEASNSPGIETSDSPGIETSDSPGIETRDSPVIQTSNPDETDRTGRSRHKTERGAQFHEEQKIDYGNRLERLWHHVESHISLERTTRDRAVMTQIEENMSKGFERFLVLANEYTSFLKRANTVDAEGEIEFFKGILTLKRQRYDSTLRAIYHFYDQCDTKSVKSEKSGSVKSKSKSNLSTSSSAVGRLRAKAEAAKTRADYAEREAEIIRKKAELEEARRMSDARAERENAEYDAQLTALTSRKEAAAAEMEARVLEESEGDRRSRIRIPVEDPAERTRRYVADQARHQQGGAPQPIDELYNVDSTPATPDRVFPEFSKFLLKKDLQLSRLTPFNDKPETFAVWKTSFTSVMCELGVTAAEELDLLVKNLGPESSKYALSIRASNARNPDQGVRRLWERLDERYGSPEMVEAGLKHKLENFRPLTNKDNIRFYDLTDILSEIEAVKEDPRYASLLSYYDSSAGVLPIASKLPHAVQQKWINEASRYKSYNDVSFPPFTFFVSFMRNISKVRNDPGLQPADSKPTQTYQDKKGFRNVTPSTTTFLTRKTDVSGVPDSDADDKVRCPIHRSSHSLKTCRTFLAKSLDERRTFVRENNLCFRCLETTRHRARGCTAAVKCDICSSMIHCTVMHSSPSTGMLQDGGEQPTVSSKCTHLCGENFRGRSCGKVVKVKVYPHGREDQCMLTYAILDDQSNHSLVKTELLDRMCVETKPIVYQLTSCAGTFPMSGRRASGLCVESLCGTHMELPPLYECNNIPGDRTEIPTSEVAESFSHLREISKNFPPLDPKVHIQLLIGRDLPEAHHVHQQLIGPKDDPFAQRLSLGWVIIGEVCLEGRHPPTEVIVNKTGVLEVGRGTIFEPCPSRINVSVDGKSVTDRFQGFPSFRPSADDFGDTVFQITKDDEKVGTSVEDREFIKIMDTEFKKDETGHWSAPLPFKSPRPKMRNNRVQAWNRALALDSSLRKDPVKAEHFMKFMAKVLVSGAAEKAPAPVKDSEYWYLPLFGVYHPKKPDSIRGVFDSSAVYQGMSLNSLLLSGPDLTNGLLGVLLRFRKDAVALSADVEQMFYQFRVNKECRDFLRFFWYEENDMNKNLIEYRMCSHVFGNKPSPAVATYGLRRTVDAADADIQGFVTRNFYVDDGLTSLPGVDEAVDLLTRTQKHLRQEGNIRLHKIASNSRSLMLAFSPEDLGKELQDVPLDDPTGNLPSTGCLGLEWKLQTDTLVFQLQLDDKPFTRRGILSVLNSIYDPLGFLTPLLISGKILLREISPGGTNWDQPILPPHRVEWEKWKNMVEQLQGIEVSRMIVPTSVSNAESTEVHIYCDASEKAIAAVAYLKTTDINGQQCVGFLLGKAKLSPAGCHTIPRLELCSAVLATELWQIIDDNLDVAVNTVQFYTDSKVVMGYLSNRTRRFYTYVSNRVEKIHRVSKPEQWNYTPTHTNLADVATRCVSDVTASMTVWLQGPDKLLEKESETLEPEEFPLVLPDDDCEVRPCVLKTDVFETNALGAQRFERFSRWDSAVKAVASLKRVAHTYCSTQGGLEQTDDVDLLIEAEVIILREVQRETFSAEVKALSCGQQVQRCSPIISLSPFLDEKGLLRIGGRLSQARQILGTGVNPILVPKQHHVSTLLVRHFHESVKHQGRHLTEGGIRSHGFWIIGAKRLVSKVISKCVVCRKLRGTFLYQKMADLPVERLEPNPPFTAVGVDTFGPWEVVTRKTRGGSANSKRWALLFTCLGTRAVHIEVVEEMTSSSFINAFRRFTAIRGPAKVLRSDRGTNFIGATDDLLIDAIHVEGTPMKTFLHNSGTKWIFNAPHSSHMGGAWERLIGVARRILDSMMLEHSRKILTHEVLCTFMAEVSAIMNSRPIANISTDPTSPMILSPSMLLTQKTGCETSLSPGLDVKDLYRSQWKCVQILSDTFWRQWKNTYLQSLQERRKWKVEKSDLKVGDLVMMKDADVPRTHWPVCLVQDAIQSEDGHVRKAVVRTIRDDKIATYTRPINELILLLE